MIILLLPRMSCTLIGQINMIKAYLLIKLLFAVTGVKTGHVIFMDTPLYGYGRLQLHRTVRSQKAVAAHLKSEQLLPFGFAHRSNKYRCIVLLGYNGRVRRAVTQWFCGKTAPCL